ncbi:MAG: transcriptional regulator [Bacteroidia bacterium]|jgi:DNA-binding MarR family transcriptional regulator|nr:transcriptional regulator [Bacteroidia bacterium]
MFKDLDPVLHAQLRLAVMSLLIGIEQADFTFLKEKTQSTAGNLSVQLTKLEEAGYITIEKTYDHKRPRTICRVTPAGIAAFEAYVTALKTYLGGTS